VNRSVLHMLCVYCGIASFAIAESTDSKRSRSRDHLIQKLETFYKTLKSNDLKKKPITLRLAHILALRAEDQLSRQYDKSCKDCRSLGIKDAKRSLFLYKEIRPAIQTKHPVLHSHSLFQMAYLNRMMDESSKSIHYLKQITRLNVHSHLLARAYFNLGEIYFEDYKYRLSLNAFNEVLQLGKTPWSFRSYYRKIWSLYNLSDYDSAIHTLEKFVVSDLYKQEVSTELGQSIKQKLQKELVILYARSQVTDQQIDFFYNFQKDHKSENTLAAKNQRLFDLATDLNRIGRSKPSNKVWNLYLTKSVSDFKKIKAYLSMLSNYWVINDKGWIFKAGEVIEALLTYQGEISRCSQDICKTVRKQVKRYLEELYRHSRNNSNLKSYAFSLYDTYNKIYPNELDTLVKAAFLSRELKKYKISQNLFQQSVRSLSLKIKKSSDKKVLSQLKKDLEQMSLLQMEMAELSGDTNRRYQSYKFYLQNGKDANTIYRVRYQLTYLMYESKQYQQAATQFKNLALINKPKSNKDIEDLALKSAHLALSSLNFLENKDLFMAEWSTLFSKRFPGEKSFTRIRHSAVFNRIKYLLSDLDFSTYPIKPSKDKRILQAWRLLNSITITTLNEEEKIKYYMNKMLLAKERLKFKEMNQIISTLLDLKTLSKDDRKVVLNWKLWLTEIHFDFYEILKLIKLINANNESESHHLYLAHLAELANSDYVSYYENYIQKYPKSKNNIDIIKHLINKASKGDKKQFLKKYASYFKNKPDDLSYIILALDHQNLDINFMKFFADLAFMKNSHIKYFLDRKFFIESFNKKYIQVSKFSLTPSVSPKRLSRSIQKYKNLISQLESEAQQSMKMKDWLSQVIAFSRVRSELVRFYESILKLPLPKGLNAKEQTQYLTLVENQMAPYKTRVIKLTQEIDKLLYEGFMDPYVKVAKNQKIFHKILKWEMNQLIQVMSDQDHKTQVMNILQFIENTPISKTVSPVKHNQQIKNLYGHLKEDPFNKDYLKQLLDLKKSKNDVTMSHYLMSRIKRINESKKGRIKL